MWVDPLTRADVLAIFAIVISGGVLLVQAQQKRLENRVRLRVDLPGSEADTPRGNSLVVLAVVITNESRRPTELIDPHLRIWRSQFHRGLRLGMLRVPARHRMGPPHLPARLPGGATWDGYIASEGREPKLATYPCQYMCVRDAVNRRVWAARRP